MFSRNYPEYKYSLWQAERNPETGIFDQQRRLTELKNNGAFVFGSWLSEDRLRLYYAAADPINLGWQIRPIWMAVRDSTDDTWQTVKRFTGLEIEALQVNPSLTADEKIMMFESVTQAGTTDRRIFTASRDDMNASFSNLQEHFELEALGAIGPQMTPNGLIVYFTRINDAGMYEAWSGSRESLTEPFTDFAPVEEINALTQYFTDTPFQSWDGKKLYFQQRQGEAGDLDGVGIFVATWVDPPEVIVDKNLTAAIEQKNVIVDQLSATIDMEIETLRILYSLWGMTEKGSDQFHAIHKTIIQVRKALQDEFWAQIKIRSSIRELEKAATYYGMEDPAPRGRSKKPDKPEKPHRQARTMQNRQK